MIYIAKNITKHPELSKEAVDAIERARARFKTGKYLTSTEAKKRLGL